MSDMHQLQRRALDELVHDFAEVFPTGKQDLGCTDRIYHKINTGDPIPLSSKLLAASPFTTGSRLRGC